IAASSERLAAARAEYQQFLARTRFHDVKAEADRTDKELLALEVAANVARRECEDCRARLAKWDEAAKGPARPVSADALTESAADEIDKPYVGRKRQLLDALKAEETKLAEADKKLEAKRRDYATVLSLWNKGGASRADVEKAHDEVQLLTLQKENSAKLVA